MRSSIIAGRFLIAASFSNAAADYALRDPKLAQALNNAETVL